MDEIPETSKKLPLYFFIILFILLVVTIALVIYILKPIENKIIVSKPPSASTATLSLPELIDQRNRIGIRNWAKDKSIPAINDSLNQLTPAQKDNLASAVLLVEGTSPPATRAIARNLILTILKQIFSKKDLGFYAEVFSYTTINIEGVSFTASCNQVNLDPAFNNLPVSEARDVLMHESLHSFNCVNNIPGGGHAGALDEGAAIWIFKAAFPENRTKNELTAGWAETTYGTLNYYRDIGVPGYPKIIPLNAAENPTQKLKDVFSWLSSHDPSKLPWNSQVKITLCYDRYYRSLDRNVDFDLWLKQAAELSQKMAIDPKCRI